MGEFKKIILDSANLDKGLRVHAQKVYKEYTDYAIISENFKKWNENIHQENNNFKPILKEMEPKYFERVLGEAIYEIEIGGRKYICVFRGTLFTSLKYHLERAFRDFHNSLSNNPNNFYCYLGNNMIFTVKKFFSSGGDIRLLKSGISKNKKEKNNWENHFIENRLNNFGKDKVWNLQKAS